MNISPPDITPSSLGLEGAAVQTYDSRPGNTYLKFPSKEAMDTACEKLKDTFGDLSFRIAQQTNSRLAARSRCQCLCARYIDH